MAFHKWWYIQLKGFTVSSKTWNKCYNFEKINTEAITGVGKNSDCKELV